MQLNLVESVHFYLNGGTRALFVGVVQICLKSSTSIVCHRESEKVCEPVRWPDNCWSCANLSEIVHFDLSAIARVRKCEPVRFHSSGSSTRVFTITC